MLLWRRRATITQASYVGKTSLEIESLEQKIPRASRERALRSKGRAVLSGSAILLIVVRCGPDPSQSRPPVDTYRLGIKINAETTRITEPLLPNGPDYAAAINIATGMGVTPVNNAVQELAPVFGMTFPETIAHRLDLDGRPPKPEARFVGGFRPEDFAEYARSRRPKGAVLDVNSQYEAFVSERTVLSDGYCSTRACPHIAAWVRANEAPLAAIARAVDKQRYWVPLEEGKNLRTAPPPDLERMTNACQALAARAELHLGDERREDAAQDVLLLQRFGVLLGQSSLESEQRVAAGCIREGNGALRRIATDPSIDVSSSKVLAHKLEEISQIGNFELVIQRERFSDLAGVFLLRELIDREGASAWKPVLEKEGEPPRPPGLYRLNVSSIDWNLAMSLVNTSWDLAREVSWSWTANEEDREKAREKFRAQLKWTAETTRTLEDARLGELMENIDRDPAARPALTRAFVDAAGLLASDPSPFLRSINEPLAERDLGILALALATERRETGKPPDDIESIVPTYLDRIPPATQFGHVLRVSRAVSAPRLALTLVPLAFPVTGSRSYCLDSEGRNLVFDDGREPEVEEGRCRDEQS